ncbi:MAG: PEP-utilizing enzyme [Patescibacteria group bacterium]
MSYQQYNWEAAGKDYNSPYLRNHLWTVAITKYRDLMGISCPMLGIASRNNQIEYIGDLATWGKTHEELKAKILADYNLLDELIDKTLQWGEEFNRWTEIKIYQADLSRATNKQLLNLLLEFIDRQATGYAYGTALPTLDFQNFSFVESNLNRFLKAKANPADFADCYTVFTEPIHNSFAQDQEEALLKLMADHYLDAEWRHSVQEQEIGVIQERYPEFCRRLAEHTQTYAWVYYVYMGPAFTINDFYGFIRDYLNRNVNPTERLAEIKAKSIRVAEAKERYLAKFRPSGLDEFILKIAGKVVWAKPRRKDYQSKSYYHAEKLLREIAKRLFVSLDQIRSLPTPLIIQALQGGEPDLTVANDIKKLHVCLPDNGQVVDLFGKAAEHFCRKVLKVESTPIGADAKEFGGVSACAGRATGCAKIINLPEDMAKMEYGDILVSSGTTPSIVPAMKKAAAIITDEGGLTCHAAIVSRELNIPCVVSLKIISRVVKDGDQLEVDATQGKVKKL